MSDTPVAAPSIHPRVRRLPAMAGALIALLVVLTFTSAAFPELVSATTYGLTARCSGVGLRTAASTTATLKARLASGTVAVAVGTVRGGSWTATCGTRVSGSSWYRISMVNGRSVKSLYGVSYVYSATGLFRVVSTATTLYAQCAPTPARAAPSAIAAVKLQLPKGTVMVSNGTVTGGAWSTSCPRAAKGSAWYRISSINGKSVMTRYGVAALCQLESGL